MTRVVGYLFSSVAGLLLAVCSDARDMHPAEPVFLASRSPMPDCVWKPYVSYSLGVRLLFQQCPDPALHYELKENGDWLEQHRPADDVIFGRHKIIRVLKKPASQTIEEAIQKNFVKKIVLDNPQDQAQARKSCIVIPVPDKPSGDASRMIFTLVPTGKYKEKVDQALRVEPRDFGCGEYGRGQSLSYFEYHPLQSKTKYLFVVYGMDEPLFDEKSIELIDE